MKIAVTLVFLTNYFYKSAVMLGNMYLMCLWISSISPSNKEKYIQMKYYLTVENSKLLQRKTKVIPYSDRNMNSSNCRNWKWKMAGITQNGQKRLIFIVIPQLRIADDTGLVKKMIVK